MTFLVDVLLDDFRVTGNERLHGALALVGCSTVILRLIDSLLRLVVVFLLLLLSLFQHFVIVALSTLGICQTVAGCNDSADEDAKGDGGKDVGIVEHGLVEKSLCSGHRPYQLDGDHSLAVGRLLCKRDGNHGGLVGAIGCYYAENGLPDFLIVLDKLL